jgi:hypothetical protein
MDLDTAGEDEGREVNPAAGEDYELLAETDEFNTFDDAEFDED